MPVASEGGFGPYTGMIYIDLPRDNTDPLYRQLQNYLENEDGSMRDNDVRFCLLSLATALKNAHHDETGFWEAWAENV
jgi:hypothetical protein